MKDRNLNILASGECVGVVHNGLNLLWNASEYTDEMFDHLFDRYG